MDLSVLPQQDRSVQEKTLSPFPSLFKKYRLRAEFLTYAQFSEALANRGFFYDVSVFSHWQKGTRIPTNRQILLTIIEIFIEREAIANKRQADEFLASTGLGYLTDGEAERLFYDASVIHTDK